MAGENNFPRDRDGPNRRSAICDIDKANIGAAMPEKFDVKNRTCLPSDEPWNLSIHIYL